MAQRNKLSAEGNSRLRQVSLKNWGDRPDLSDSDKMPKKAVIDCGWGRLIFGQTFDRAEDVAAALEAEVTGRRDVAIYVREPHVVLACAPQTLFLDPSHTFRLEFDNSAEPVVTPEGLTIRPAKSGDENSVNRLYAARSMVPVATDCFSDGRTHPSVTYLVAAETGQNAEVVGVVMGIDHRAAINDTDNGSSLWALAVDPQVRFPGIGQALVLALADKYRTEGRQFLDLSVMHDNMEAIRLYGKLGFEQIPVYSVKKKNPINEKLFIGPDQDTELNIYARIIVDEARRRGIHVEVEDSKAGLFKLSHGGRSVSCRESLSGFTSAVAMSRCDDKALTHRLLKRAGLKVPAQAVIAAPDELDEFLDRFKRIVVKPARGEQGNKVAVDLQSRESARAAFRDARTVCDQVIAEEFVEGREMRIIVIDGAVVATAERRPPVVQGDGTLTIRKLISKLSRRRQSATAGESRIPLDDETERSVKNAGYELDDVLPEGESLTVRKTSNLHTGGTIHDVTENLHQMLRQAAVKAAAVLDIPVVGLDLIVSDPEQAEYVLIEANERPGLANHEPQPTAEKFIDLLFPQSVSNRKRMKKEN